MIKIHIITGLILFGVMSVIGIATKQLSIELYTGTGLGYLIFSSIIQIAANREKRAYNSRVNTERIQELQNRTAWPKSHSVQEALLQVWNECEQEKDAEIDNAIDIMDGNQDVIDWRDCKHSELLRKLCEHLEVFRDMETEIEEYKKAITIANKTYRLTCKDIDLGERVEELRELKDNALLQLHKHTPFEKGESIARTMGRILIGHEAQQLTKEIT